MNLCKYKDVLGKPNEGIRKIRDPVFGTALSDVIIMLLASFLISNYFNYSLSSVVILMFILSVLAHRLFCVRTTVDKFLFPSNN